MTLPEGALSGFSELIGLEIVEASGDRVIARFSVRSELHQAYGILHGGVHCSVVETAASLGAALWVGESGAVVGVANHTNFLRAVREGTLTAEAIPIHRGRTQQLWLVVITDDAGRAVARGEVRLANVASATSLGRPRVTG